MATGSNVASWGALVIPWNDAKLILLGATARAYETLRLLFVRFYIVTLLLVLLAYMGYAGIAGLVSIIPILLLSRSSLVRKDWRYLLMSRQTIIACASLVCYVGILFLQTISLELLEDLAQYGTYLGTVAFCVWVGVLNIAYITTYYLLDARKPIREVISATAYGFHVYFAWLISFWLLLFFAGEYVSQLLLAYLRNISIYNGFIEYVITLPFITWHFSLLACMYEYVRYRDEV